MRRIIIGIVILCGLMLIMTSGYLSAQDDEDEDTQETESTNESDEADESEQADEPLEYMGVGDCNDCHGNLSDDHELTPHALALSDEPERILADFSTGEDVRTVQFPDEDEARPFTVEDIAYVMGAGRYIQQYVYATGDGGYRVFPAIWDNVEKVWLPYEAGENWLEDEEYDWLTQCAYCHTTGFDAETNEWEDDGVQCETCHGPGSAHVELADELPRNPEPEEVLAVRDAIVVSADAQICGQCHAQGMDDDDIHPFPTQYRPGDDLEDNFDISEPGDDDHWWESEHGKSMNMQFNEWMETGHDYAFDDVADSSRATDECLFCHSADFRLAQRLIEVYEEGDMEDPAPEPATLDNAEFGVTCIACHDPHIVNEEDEENPHVDYYLVDEPYNLCATCHTQTDITPNIHSPMQQMFEGLPLVEGIDGIPSAHFVSENGPDCHTCHMTRQPIVGFGYTLPNHTWRLVYPLETEEGQPDSCSQCHEASEDGITLVNLQSLITDIQEDTRERLSAASDRLDTLEEPAETDDTWAVYNQAANALEFVQQDGSLGIHNFAYTDRLLTTAENLLTLLGVPAEETEVETGTETETETSTETETVQQATAEPMATEEVSIEDVEFETPASSVDEGIEPVSIAIMAGSLVLLAVSALAFFGRRGNNHA